MSGATKISVIIANWNGAHHLRICLPSLLAQTLKPSEIIVVDNSSSDDSEAVTRQFDGLWLPLDTNSGLAPALNRGAAVAAGDWLLFVNNDMRFDPEFVSALLEPMKGDEKLFATDSMQWNWEGSKREHLGASLLGGRAIPAGSSELVPGLQFCQREALHGTAVFMGSAACMLIRKKYFDELGGFDSRLPLGYEDVEICWRAWLHGWKTVYVPNAICWHRVGSSGRSREGMRMNFRGILRGRLLFSSKLLPLRYAIRTWLVSVAALAKDVGRGQWRFAQDRLRILSETIIMVPQLLKERRQLFAKAGVTPEQHLKMLLELSHNHVDAR